MSSSENRSQYAIWTPPDMKKANEERIRNLRSKAEEAKKISAERAGKAAERVVDAGGGKYVRGYVENTKALATIVKNVADMRCTNDSLTIDNAAIRGAVLDMQRTCFILASTLGTSMRQPLGPPGSVSGDNGGSSKEVIDSLRSSMDIVLEAINALSLIKATQAASSSRLKLLEESINFPQVDPQMIHLLMSGDPSVGQEAINVQQGVERLAPSIDIIDKKQLIELVEIDNNSPESKK